MANSGLQPLRNLIRNVFQDTMQRASFAHSDRVFLSPKALYSRPTTPRRRYACPFGYVIAASAGQPLLSLPKSTFAVTTHRSSLAHCVAVLARPKARIFRRAGVAIAFSGSQPCSSLLCKVRYETLHRRSFVQASSDFVSPNARHFRTAVCPFCPLFFGRILCALRADAFFLAAAIVAFF